MQGPLGVPRITTVNGSIFPVSLARIGISTGSSSFVYALSSQAHGVFVTMISAPPVPDVDE